MREMDRGLPGQAVGLSTSISRVIEEKDHFIGPRHAELVSRCLFEASVTRLKSLHLQAEIFHPGPQNIVLFLLTGNGCLELRKTA